jgi:sugar lactone lactonase YvrE
LAAVIYWIGQRVGWRHLRHMIVVAVVAGLSLLTFRSAWMASFINYDYANEYLVYAHAAPGIKLMTDQIEELSRRTSDGLNMRFAWGGNAWPVTWYFRDLNNAVFFGGNPTFQVLEDAVAVYASGDIRARVEPLLEDRYYRFEYIRMWWPMQDYFNLTPQRVMNAFDPTPTNTQASEIRRGLFDIWWSRDYTRYGEAVGGDYSLRNWPVSERLYFYVRKDIAAQVWNLGVGDGTALAAAADTATANVCTSNWQQRYADVVYSQMPLNHPLDVQVAADGRLYVAEEFGNRISIFDPTGAFVGTLGDVTGLNRPNGLALFSDNSLYVADTWNYRIQRFGQDGSLLGGWGQPGQYGIEAQIEPVDGFWGPRDVAVDAAGNVYVADTGNKRVRVYSPDGVYIRDIGSGGSMEGQLDEPSGLAISPDERLYVADTWNKRVSVFALDGTSLFNFPVRGWYEDQGNRPYLAIDGARNLLYVTDPNAGRVLVFDLQGNCVGSFGQPSDQAVDGSQFQVVGGITLDSQGNVYVADATAGRVLRFAPFLESAAAANGQSEQVIVGEQIIAQEVTPELTAPLDGGAAG